MLSKNERIKWFLSELSNQDESDIDSNEIEILGESDEGVEGYATVKITDIAKDAHELIHELETESNKMREALKYIAKSSNGIIRHAAHEALEEVASKAESKCTHDFVSADNEVVKGGVICTKCHAVRAA